MSTPKLYTDSAQVIADLNAKGVAIGKVNPDQYHSWKAIIEAEMSCPVVSKSTLADFPRTPTSSTTNKSTASKRSLTPSPLALWWIVWLSRLSFLTPNTE